LPLPRRRRCRAGSGRETCCSSGGFGHVGIYIGGGRMIHAPRSGSWVRYERLSQGWLKSAFSGAARPGA
jgi:cell wall-associated NlpC family hydrolase